MKFAWICKYVPVEMLKSAGVEMVRLQPDVTGFEKADCLLHSNMCSFIKASLEEYAEGEYDGIILTNCCDSTRRLYDCIKEEFPDRFCHMLDVPRLVTESSCDLYTESLKNLAELLKEKGLPPDMEKLRETLKNGEEVPHPDTECDAKIRLAIMGARLGESVRRMISEYDVAVMDDMTCTQTDRCYAVPDEQDLIQGYAFALLNQFPCMRMAETAPRMQRLEEQKESVDGILYHTMKFCDMYSYEFAYLSRRETIPVLKIETDSTPQSSGQVRTRLEAFFESIVQAKGLPAESIRKTLPCSAAESDGDHSDMTGKKKKNGSGKKIRARRQKNSMDSTFRVIGIDSGSTSTNAVLMDENKKIMGSVVIRTGAKSIESAEKACRQVAEEAGIRMEEIDLTVSTGYGRINIDFADREITEISCHGRGAHYFNPDVRTILDIGGQDSKAIHIDKDGNVLDFAMNDKCAAGTGRFLEMMASTLAVDMDELGPLSLEWREDIDISSMCSVFAESEVISLIADNKEKADIAHGVHKSIASRAVSLMRRVGLEEGLMMTGGVAKNQGAVKEIEKKAGHRIIICENPEIVGAVGAALFGIEELTAEQ